MSWIPQGELCAFDALGRIGDGAMQGSFIPRAVMTTPLRVDMSSDLVKSVTVTISTMFPARLRQRTSRRQNFLRALIPLSVHPSVRHTADMSSTYQVLPSGHEDIAATPYRNMGMNKQDTTSLYLHQSCMGHQSHSELVVNAGAHLKCK